MKIIINKNTYFNLLIYLIGVLHWFFFFYFVDYYEYNNENIYNEIEIIDEKSDIVDHDYIKGYFFSSPISINRIANKYLDTDEVLFKSFVKKPNVEKLFKYKKPYFKKSILSERLFISNLFYF